MIQKLVKTIVPSVQCIGRVNSGLRCKNKSTFLFVCKKHILQFSAFLIITIPTILLTFSKLYEYVNHLFPDNSISIRQNTVLISEYPGKFVYHFHEGNVGRVTPIGYMAYLDVTNTSDERYYVNTYSLKIKMNGDWISIPHLAVKDLEEVYAVPDNSDLCIRLDFRNNSLDRKLRSSELEPGQTFRGWVFFQWPKELMAESSKIKEVAYTFSNNKGEILSERINSIYHKSGSADLIGTSIIHHTEDILKNLSDHRFEPLIDPSGFYEEVNSTFKEAVKQGFEDLAEEKRDSLVKIGHLQEYEKSKEIELKRLSQNLLGVSFYSSVLSEESAVSLIFKNPSEGGQAISFFRESLTKNEVSFILKPSDSIRMNLNIIDKKCNCVYEFNNIPYQESNYVAFKDRKEKKRTILRTMFIENGSRGIVSSECESPIAINEITFQEPD